jgi:Short C-terminal domain
MGYLFKSILGAGLFFGGVVLFNVKLVELLETGTCASGNVPYEIAPGYQCPDDTGTNILLMTASIFGGLIGAAIFAFRGEPPWGGGGGRRGFGGMFGAGTFAWGIFFAATGATSLLAALTNDAIQNSNGGELGGIIVGATFLLMGVPALLVSLWGLAKGFGGRDERPSFAAATGPASGIGKLERLQKLRESGALTDGEFEREKAKILAE